MVLIICIIDQMSSETGKINKYYVGELPLVMKVIEQIGLREIFLKHIRRHGNEKIPAVESLIILLCNISVQPLFIDWDVFEHNFVRTQFDIFQFLGCELKIMCYIKSRTVNSFLSTGLPDVIA